LNGTGTERLPGFDAELIGQGHSQDRRRLIGLKDRSTGSAELLNADLVPAAAQELTKPLVPKLRPPAGRAEMRVDFHGAAVPLPNAHARNEFGLAASQMSAEAVWPAAHAQRVVRRQVDAPREMQRLAGVQGLEMDFGRIGDDKVAGHADEPAVMFR
jgi:hypothetical protein